MNNRALRSTLATSLFIHCTSLLCSVLGAVIAYISWRLGIFTFDRLWLFALFPILSSFMIGSFLTFTAGRRIVRFVKSINTALRQIAAGDYNIELREKTPVLELREIIQSFNAMTRELAATEMMRNDFVENVSHEFKTPLTAIEGYATLLQQRNLSEEKREEYTQKILHNTRRLNNLTGNILLLSRLENQEPELRKEAYSLDEQLRECILLMEPIWSEKDIDLLVDLEDCTFTGNRELLAQVWQNMFGNAVKFTPARGAISVSLGQDSGHITIRFSDNGPGMTEAEQKRAFEKFYQADRSRSSSGNGLGLALAKRIIDLHGGAVAVESAPGKGSKFTVTLPAAQR